MILTFSCPRGSPLKSKIYIDANWHSQEGARVKWGHTVVFDDIK